MRALKSRAEGPKRSDSCVCQSAAQGLVTLLLATDAVAFGQSLNFNCNVAHLRYLFQSLAQG